jgi:hypothetical protein
MRANLSVLGDGVIVLGLGIFIVSIGYVDYQSVQQSITSAAGNPDALRSAQQGMTTVIGLLAFGAAVLIAGLLKIGHAFSSLKDEKQSGLKTPVAVAAFFILFYILSGSFFFLGRI